VNKTIQQIDYTPYAGEYQLKLQWDTEIKIAKDEPVRLLSAIVERMDIRGIERSYSHSGRKEYPPRILLKVLIYAYMRHIYSSREIERACRENILFMYLLEGYPAPDHNTISRFRSKILAENDGELMKQMTEILEKLGCVSMETVFIDGTKIEANGNRYNFVWRKAVEKYNIKLREKIQQEISKLVCDCGVRWRIPEKVEVRHLKKLRKKLYEKAGTENICFVYGKGKRKNAIQRGIEKVNEWLNKLKQYTRDLHICGERNSYCKTDHDATFMHLKEDHMKNGQLKPAYNVNVATSEEFIIGNYISSDRTDVNTLIPFMERLTEYCNIKRLCADAGYESEENYCWFENSTVRLYVKPTNHEIKKAKKYKTDISRRENMQYDTENDSYTCAAGKLLTLDYVKKEKTATGFETEKSVYSCKDCEGCSLKEKCIKSKSSKPLEERSKVIYVSKRFTSQREAMEERINTEEGKLIRVNRSIQAEGVFAMIKEDMNFRRFMLRGAVKVEVEWTLLSLAYNVLKLHNKAKTGRLGTGLVRPKSFPIGL